MFDAIYFTELFYALKIFENILCMDMMNNYFTHRNNSYNNIISSLLKHMTEHHFPINIKVFVIDGIKILRKLVFLPQAKIVYNSPICSFKLTSG